MEQLRPLSVVQKETVRKKKEEVQRVMKTQVSNSECLSGSTD